MESATHTSVSEKAATFFRWTNLQDRTLFFGMTILRIVVGFFLGSSKWHLTQSENADVYITQ